MSQIQKLPEAMEKEVKAYIYQRLSEVEKMLTPGSTLQVTLSETPAGKKTESQVNVKIHVKTPQGNIVCQAACPDVFAAIDDAKDELFERLTFIRATDPSAIQDRSDTIAAIVSKTYLH